MVEVDLAGNQISGSRGITSEIRIHLYIYQQRPDIHSVVHVHPPHATAFAVAHRALPKGILPETEFNLGEVPIAPYTHQGTWEFARSISPWVHDYDCFLLANHGAITLGRDPYDAYYRMETLDQYCHVLLLAAQAGGWNSFGRKAMEDLLRLKALKGVGDRRLRSGDDPLDPATPGRTGTPGEHGVYHPAPGEVTDAPKAGASQWPPKVSEKDIRMLVEAVIRRIGSGG